MFKPIRTVRLKTVGLGMRFANKITERAAVIGSYELSESELVFAMGAAREKDDLMSVLELLDKVLGLIRRGFDRRVNSIILRIINNVGIMLGRGGLSVEYFNTAEIYNKISAAVYGKNENFNISECRSEINKQLSVLRSEQTYHIRGSGHKGFGANALRFFKTVSDRETLTVNTLNSGLFRVMSRNPELVKMLKQDKTFMELSLKNIGHIHRRTERTVTAQRFYESLTAQQIGLLGKFVVNENLFSELRERSIDKPDLRYLLENSSEKSLAEFFETLKQKIELQSKMLSEQSYFNSAEEMREFFVTAQRSDIERLIKTVETERPHSVEAKILTEAFRLYKEKTKKPDDPKMPDKKMPDNESETVTEIFGNSEAVLNFVDQITNDENFSAEQFINALNASAELKKIFAEYAWENYRSDETLSRYAEYIGNTVPEDGLSDFEGTVIHNDSSTISESTEAHIDETNIDETLKMSFADFLINSDELVQNFSEADLFETLKQKIESQIRTRLEQSYFNSAEEMKEFFVSAQLGDIERLIKTLETDRSHSVEVRTLTEALRLYKDKAKRQDNPKISDNESETFTEFFRNSEAVLNYVKQKINNENFSAERFINALGASSELKKVFAEYARENYRSDETLRRYAEYIGNTVSEVKLSDFEQAVIHTGGSTVSESTETHIDETSMMSFADFLINSGELVMKLSESVKNNFLSASPDVISAFAEYLVNTVRDAGPGYYSEQIRMIAEKAENILYYGDTNFEEKSDGNYSLVFSLISNAWNENALQLSELYSRFTSSRIGSEEILKLYSYLPKNNFKAVSEFFEAAAQGDKYFLDLSKEISDRTHSFSNNIGVFDIFDIKEESADEYDTFYDVLCDMSENTLILLLPLAGVNSGNVFGGENTGLTLDNSRNDTVIENPENITFYDVLSEMPENTPELLLPLAGVTGGNVFGVENTELAPDNSRNDTVTENYENISLTDQASALITAAVFAEYLSDTVTGDVTGRYNERTHSLAERLLEILHGEPQNTGEGISVSRSAEAIDLIYNEWNYDHTQMSELYESFTQSFSNREDIYSRLLQSSFADISNSVIVNSAADFLGLNSVISKQAEKFFEQIKVLKNITNTDLYNAEARDSNLGETLENTSELVFSFADMNSGTSPEQLPTAAVNSDSAFTANELRRIMADLTSFSNVLNRSERRIYNISQAENKSIVTNKAFYNAFTAVFGEAASDNITNSIFSEYFYPGADITPREFFFTWESENITLFNRMAADKRHNGISGFFEKRSSDVLTLSNKITEKFSAENQSYIDGAAAELFYTDEYFERSVSGAAGSQTVNYAFPAAAASGGSDEVSEKIGNIREAIDNINTEIVGIRQREEENSREFVKKSEQKIFEKELKTSIERDIYLAGKRHGIY